MVFQGMKNQDYTLKISSFFSQTKMEDKRFLPILQNRREPQKV